MDLSDEPDEAVPFSIKLKAIDGLASLKYFDFVPSTTTQNPESLYLGVDTFLASPLQPLSAQWKTFIDLISICLSYAGFSDTDTGASENPQIVSAVRWYNGLHPNITDDPLIKTRTKTITFYEQETQDDGILKYKAQSCYDVLKSVCSAWGMRVVLWNNKWCFIQVNQYRENESGTNLAPDNINIHTYDMDGAAVSTSDDIDTWWGKYFIPLSSAGLSTVRNYKITGGQYGILPALKQVTVDFMNVDNINYFTQFPPIATYDSSYENRWTHSIIGTFTFDGVTDQSFYQRIILNVSNPSSGTGYMDMTWGLFARAAGGSTPVQGDSPHDNGFDYQMMENMAASPTIPTVWKGFANWYDGGTAAFSLGSSYFYGITWGQIPVEVGTTTVDILNNSHSTTWDAAYRYPVMPASVFTAGDWEFAYYTRNYFWSSSAATEHGSLYFGSGTGPTGGFFAEDLIDVNYVNSPAQHGQNSSVFSPIVNGAIGNHSENTTITQSTSDTETLKLSDILFGDTATLASGGALQVYDGSDWVLTDIAGDWGIDTLLGDNSFSEQLIADILNAQGKTTKTFTVQTTLDPTIGVYYNDGTSNRPIFACPFTKFFTPTHSASGTLGTSWLMNTATWFPARDTWKWKLYEQENYAVSGTTTTTGNAGSNTGLYGGAGMPIPTSGNVPIAPPPSGNLGPTQNQQLRLLNTQQIAFITKVKTAKVITATSTPFEQTITFLDVDKMATEIFKEGDVFSVHTNSFDFTSPSGGTGAAVVTEREPLTFEVASDTGVGATRITVVSKTITRNIEAGDIISFDVKDMISEYQRKTSGTIGGMTVTSDSIDGAKSVGRHQVFFRGEGDSLTEGNYYCLNGEDNNKSGRFGFDNTLAPTQIATQRALKSGNFICDVDYKIESGTSVITGDAGWDIKIQLYKTTPVDDSTAATTMTLIGEFDVELDGDSKTQIDALGSLSTETIAKGDIIIPHIYAAVSGGGNYDFRGGITYTLIRES